MHGPARSLLSACTGNRRGRAIPEIAAEENRAGKPKSGKTKGGRAGGSEPDFADNVHVSSAYGFPDSSESQPGPDRDGTRRLRDFRERTGKPRFPFVVIGDSLEISRTRDYLAMRAPGYFLQLRVSTGGGRSADFAAAAVVQFTFLLVSDGFPVSLYLRSRKCNPQLGGEITEFDLCAFLYISSRIVSFLFFLSFLFSFFFFFVFTSMPKRVSFL